MVHIPVFATIVRRLSHSAAVLALNCFLNSLIAVAVPNGPCAVCVSLVMLSKDRGDVYLLHRLAFFAYAAPACVEGEAGRVTDRMEQLENVEPE